MSEHTCPLCEQDVQEPDDKVLIVMDEKRGPELVHAECLAAYCGSEL